jgi:transcriptional regulator with PAS, ATPase and Fis domain
VESSRPAADSLSHRREALERDIIQRALVALYSNRVRAAHALGVSRVTLSRKMR